MLVDILLCHMLSDKICPYIESLVMGSLSIASPVVWDIGVSGRRQGIVDQL